MSKSRGGSTSSHAQRSNSHNPNNAAYQQAVDNRANQLNPNNPAYYSSRGETPPGQSGPAQSTKPSGSAGK